ncbi:hypothetical protein ACIQGW_03840 [Lysinibacillus xylanilyticus]|uniref:hypothetical protein n=1 Tax=Lysinibacillus xylanilyticus TaxID=582475 RepID=UPI00381F32EE
MKQTVKGDWLNDHLASNSFVSGHESFRIQLNLPEGSIPSIRYINLSGKYLWLLTIEVEEEKWDIIKNEIETNAVFKFINSKFENQLNILLFSSEKVDCFSYKSHNGNFVDTGSNGLKKILNNELSGINQNIGTRKLQNKSLNDNFQKWTRENLSMYSVINDFDALKLTDEEGKKSFIYELKRVQEDITTWEPYIDDTRNYQRMNNISSKLGFSNITISYNIDNSDEYAVHYNLKPTSTQISGRRIIFNIKSGYDKSTNTQYVSVRERQK